MATKVVPHVQGCHNLHFDVFHKFLVQRGTEIVLEARFCYILPFAQTSSRVLGMMGLIQKSTTGLKILRGMLERF